MAVLTENSTMSSPDSVQDWFGVTTIHEHGEDTPAAILSLAVVFDGKVATVPLQNGKYSIGRDPHSSILINSPVISRNHAIIQIHPEGYIEISDRGSANGTYVASKRLEAHQPVVINIGDNIHLGQFVALVLLPEKQTQILQHEFNNSAHLTMEQIEERVDLISKTDHTVLICGETGVGKEILARRIHQLSPRRSFPFEVINMAQRSDNLIDDDLFGHDCGAYTGANQKRFGLMRAAAGGTILLDEIGDMPLSVQAKLLRILDNREFRPIGSDRTQIANIRFLAATHRDLDQLVRQNAFKHDLLERLRQWILQIPPLRERPLEIPQLVRSILLELAGESRPITARAMAALQSCHWPGNIRELKNAISRALVMADAQPIDLCHLIDLSPSRTSNAEEEPTSSDATSSWAAPPQSRKQALKLIEREHIKQALLRNGGNKSRASRDLHMSRGTLDSRINRLGLNSFLEQIRIRPR